MNVSTTSKLNPNQQNIEPRSNEEISSLLAAIRWYGEQKYLEGSRRADKALTQQRSAWDGVYGSVQKFASKHRSTCEIQAANSTVRAALQRTRQLFDEALPKFNWSASFLDADAIKLLNEVPAEVEFALSSLSSESKVTSTPDLQQHLSEMQDEHTVDIAHQRQLESLIEAIKDYGDKSVGHYLDQHSESEVTASFDKVMGMVKSLISPRSANPFF